MAAKFKSIKKTLPEIYGQKSYGYYASMITSGNVSLKEISRDLANYSSINSPDILAVLELLTQKLPDYLADGKRVNLGDLGTFSLGISSKKEESPEQVTAKSIIKKRVMFQAGREINKTLNYIRFERKSG